MFSSRLSVVDITPCSLLKVNRRFRRTCRPHFQGRISWEVYQLESGKLVSGSSYSTFKIEAICSSETSVTFNWLLGFISQKTVLFITTAVVCRKSKYMCEESVTQFRDIWRLYGGAVGNRTTFIAICLTDYTHKFEGRDNSASDILNA
jgi:hypothetical protein